MVARPEQELMQHLYSSDPASCLKAIREVKNQIIGNKTKKLSFVKLGVVPRVVELLATEGGPDDAAIKVQSATAVGSFAYGVPDGLQAVVDSGGVASLLTALHSKEEKVVEASVRSLKMIFQVCWKKLTNRHFSINTVHPGQHRGAGCQRAAAPGSARRPPQPRHRRGIRRAPRPSSLRRLERPDCAGRPPTPRLAAWLAGPRLPGGGCRSPGTGVRQEHDGGGALCAQSRRPRRAAGHGQVEKSTPAVSGVQVPRVCRQVQRQPWRRCGCD